MFSFLKVNDVPRSVVADDIPPIESVYFTFIHTATHVFGVSPNQLIETINHEISLNTSIML